MSAFFIVNIPGFHTDNWINLFQILLPNIDNRTLYKTSMFWITF